jgi:group I intron endonuclease
MLVYEAKFPNGKRYIGLTTKTLKRRMIEHKHHSKYSNTRFYNAVRKYGWENITWSVIAKCSTEEEMKEKEIQYIKDFRTLERDFGYNLREGGDGGTHSEETKRKISIKNSGENNPMYGRTGDQHHNTGRKFSEEHRRKLSEAHMGHTPWNKGMKGEYTTGPRSEETKRKISENNSGENNGQSKLNWDNVREIREKYSTGEHTQKQLAVLFGVSQTQINSVVNNRSWRENEEQ